MKFLVMDFNDTGKFTPGLAKINLLCIHNRYRANCKSFSVTEWSNKLEQKGIMHTFFSRFGTGFMTGRLEDNILVFKLRFFKRIFFKIGLLVNVNISGNS